LKGFSGFLGKYITKNIKKQIYSLIHSKDNLNIFKVEYFTNVIDVNDLTDLDFSKSKAFKNAYNTDIDNEEVIFDSEEEEKRLKEDFPEEEFYIYDIDVLEYSENDFLKKMLPLISSNGKKIVTYTREKIENYSSNVIGYFVINGNNIYFYI
jgi:hypothetical protein